MLGIIRIVFSGAAGTSNDDHSLGCGSQRVWLVLDTSCPPAHTVRSTSSALLPMQCVVMV